MDPVDRPNAGDAGDVRRAAELVEALAARDTRALARAISAVEAGTPLGAQIVRAAYPRTGRATILGVTGSPGAGKSTLVDRCLAAYRGAGHRVAVVAVDPSSAYSGGAILGDRVRMMDHATDDDVFIRSMATRGHLGGLARATSDVVDLLDAAGFDPVIVETVGVGQDEVDVVRMADAVTVVLVPGMGDDIQAIKAGILEIADLFAVNKADRPGADRLVADIRYMLSLAESDEDAPEIVQTVASENRGIDDLVAATTRFLASRGTERAAARRRDRAEARFRAVVSDRALATILARVLPGELFSGLVDEIAARKIDPYSAADRVLDHVEVR